MRGHLFIVPMAALVACAPGDGSPSDSSEPAAAGAAPPHVVAETPVEAGRYLVLVAGCNDCHTDRYLATNGDVPEQAWLLGSPMGWRGPWGTTYAKNLRLTAANVSEDAWVSLIHSGGGLPPMPWMNARAMSDADARAMYRYIQSLGTAGEPMPAPVPPDQEPTTPYVLLQPVMPE